jgi:hypothetical protein
VVIQYRAVEKVPRACELVIHSNDPQTPVKCLDVIGHTIWDTGGGGGCCCEPRKSCCEEPGKSRCEERPKACCNEPRHACCDEDEDEEAYGQ